VPLCLDAVDGQGRGTRLISDVCDDAPYLYASSLSLSLSLCPWDDRRVEGTVLCKSPYVNPPGQTATAKAGRSSNNSSDLHSWPRTMGGLASCSAVGEGTCIVAVLSYPLHYVSLRLSITHVNANTSTGPPHLKSDHLVASARTILYPSPSFLYTRDVDSKSQGGQLERCL
jgi:hypothetical protein